MVGGSPALTWVTGVLLQDLKNVLSPLAIAGRQSSHPGCGTGTSSCEAVLKSLLATGSAAAAHDPQNTDAIARRRGENLHRERHPELPSVDHVGLPGGLRGSALRRGGSCKHGDQAWDETLQPGHCVLSIHKSRDFRMKTHGIARPVISLASPRPTSSYPLAR